jgi:hypothetical protein
LAIRLFNIEVYPCLFLIPGTGLSWRVVIYFFLVPKLRLGMPVAVQSVVVANGLENIALLPD